MAEDERCDDLNVEAIGPMVPPAILLEEHEVNKKGKEAIRRARKAVKSIMDGEDDRMVVIVGPCSVHDVEAAKDYATRLAGLHKELAGELLIIMRVYFEKPRTTVGWKGLINDPELNGSNRINVGLRTARELMCFVANLELPIGCEFLDTITPQFIADTISWAAIGARTTESQIHRELASGCSMPIGFKNGTGGSLQIAIDAIRAASCPHTFPGVTKQGLAAVVRTKGNAHCHVILRGASTGPNYSEDHVKDAREKLGKHKLREAIMIDVSHGNSLKKYENQSKVLADVGGQVAKGNKAIFGVMIESNINEGSQTLNPGVTDPVTLKYGVSVTDSCVNWATTEVMLRDLARSVKERRSKN
eukprot:TRINITY_DN1602_c5_g1_i1.p1 TRINITY_DN1602_c5_g1~~TRINITY_DN1602_c5_g1_i1.p1  ORF type:complete len:360 (+),score=96.91 TRINITY_DN1602_c5_g1_i1:59-1138(+)